MIWLNITRFTELTRKIENFVRIFHLSKKPPPQTELGKNELHRDSSQTKGEISSLTSEFLQGMYGVAS